MKLTLPRKLNRNEKILSGLILLVGCFTFQTGAIHHWKVRSNQLNQEIDELRTKNQTGHQLYEELMGRIPQTIEPLRAREMASRLDHVKDSASTFVTKLVDFDQPSHFHILKITTDTPGPFQGLIRTPVSVDVETSFLEIGNFLEKFEDSPLVAEVETMEIYRVQSDLKKCSARIKLLTYEMKAK